MTAEVVALNKSAAAMAADSKGTVRIGDFVKTHDTVNKLFTLSKYHPVGVMIYGNAEVLGVPWETIIKIYRDKLRNRCLSRLNSYANDFVAALSLDYTTQIRENGGSDAYWIAREFLEKILDFAERSIEDNPSLPIDDAIENSFEVFKWSVVQRPVLYGFRSISKEEVSKECGGEIERAVEAAVEKKYRAQFKKLAVSAISEAFRRPLGSRGHSGVVFSGFGDSEIFPAAKAFIIDGCVAGRVRGFITHKLRIGNEISASIVPFAQSEMVYRFMEGIDPNYRQYLEEALDGVVREVAASLVDKYVSGTKARKAAVTSDVLKVAESQIKHFIEESRKYRTEHFADPIITMAQLLPKEELGHLAESFVNLTSLKRRVSLDDESVGGPIDVAVISKGDGFVWLKRKHYFDPGLNGTFVANYFRQHEQKEGETGRERIRKSRV